MSKPFREGAVVRPTAPKGTFTNGCTRAVVLSYSHGFYQIRVGASDPLVVHENEITLVDATTREQLQKLITEVEESGRLWDDSQQDLGQAQADATRDEVAAMKKLLVVLAKTVIDGPE